MFPISQGGNYACLQEKGYHIVLTSFNASVLVAEYTRSTSLPSVLARTGSECNADRDRSRDDRGVRHFHWSSLGRKQPQTQRLSQWHPIVPGFPESCKVFVQTNCAPFSSIIRLRAIHQQYYVLSRCLLAE